MLAAQEAEFCSAGAFQQPAGSSSSLGCLYPVSLVQHLGECSGRCILTCCVCLRLIYPYITWEHWFWLLVRHNSLQCKCAGHFLHWIFSRSFENKFWPQALFIELKEGHSDGSHSLKLAEKPLLKSTVRSPCASRDLQDRNTLQEQPS